MSLHYTDDFVTLHHGDCREVLADLPADSVDAVVTDPPYGLEFMGKGWDAPWKQTDALATARMNRDNPGRGFEAWCTEWATQCYRVLKPGGHLLAFGGSRTWHRLAAGIEDAGFEVRDSIAWLYGSGFPKSRNVTAAMDAYLTGADAWLYGSGFPKSRNVTAAMDAYLTGADELPDIYKVTAFLREARDHAGWTNKRIDALFGTNGMAGHWTTAASQPACPSVRQWEILKTELGFGDDLDDLVEGLASTERPDDWGHTGGGNDDRFLSELGSGGGELGGGGDWGTALKPAFEPIVVARKRPAGAMVANVAAYGTGAFNLAECRTRVDGEDVGRWPTNVLFDESQAATLDEQTGVLTSGKLEAHHQRNPKDAGILGAYGSAQGARGFGDSGGASRFFPTFRYEAKPGNDERPEVDGIAHPTVKPLALMQWLVKLVTPPEALVLEPFAGSGTTIEACLRENRRCVAIENDADYLPLILSRITKPVQVDLFGGAL